MQNIGIIGAGQMGSGIAYVCSLAGFNVRLHDLSKDRINAGLDSIKAIMMRQIEKGAVSRPAGSAALECIKPAFSYQDLSTCDLVIEAATENEEVKRKILTSLCTSLRPDAMIATNTSSISITRLAAFTDRPENFIGIHFMNPVPVIQLVG